MALAALDAVGDAVEATKRFLVPVDRVRWFRLAVVVLFVGGVGAGFPNVPFGGFGVGDTDAPDTAPGADPGQITPEVTPALVALVVGIVVLLVAVALLWSVAGAVMEFVFVASLRTEDVRLWTYFKRHWWRGVRLFAFRAVVWLLTASALFSALLGVGVALGGWPIGQWGDGAVLGIVLVGIPLFLLALLVTGNVLGFTTMFVVPVMLAEDRGVVSAWRRFWPTLVADWREYLVYLVLAFLLGIAVGIASGFLSLLAFVALAVPFAVVGIPLVVLLGLDGAGALVAVVLALAFVVVLVVALLLVRVPFQTFLRYYALFVLGDTNPDFDVIPDARAAVRADGEGGVGPGATGGDPPDSGGGGGGDGDRRGGTGAGDSVGDADGRGEAGGDDGRDRPATDRDGGDHRRDADGWTGDGDDRS